VRSRKKKEGKKRWGRGGRRGKEEEGKKRWG
jgi:hypothetical protein